MVYKGFEIETIEHPKLVKHFAVFDRLGRHVWNAKTKSHAKKICDQILKTSVHPELNIKWEL